MIDFEKNFQAILMILTNNTMAPSELESLEPVYHKYKQELDFESFAIITAYCTKKYKKIPKTTYLKNALQDFINRALTNKYDILKYLLNPHKKGQALEPPWLAEYIANITE